MNINNTVHNCMIRESRIFLFIISIIFLTACLPTSVSETAEYTSSTPELAARLSAQFPDTAVPPSPTHTPQIVATQTRPAIGATVTYTALASATSTITYTSTSVPPATLTHIPKVAIPYNAVNLRRGPREDYPIIGFLYEGDVVEIIGIYGGLNGWYNVRLANDATGWVAIAVVEPVFVFDVTSIPTVVTIPATSTPTPTNTPTPTATFTPRPRPPQPKPTKPNATPIPPTATVNPYP